ncbi:hypothetical protein AU197_07935 [Mycobacterium sp. IS-1590]|nr:hypothetical protein AU197_07935 [Mycobacterium sp. IS-1590]
MDPIARVIGVRIMGSDGTQTRKIRSFSDIEAVCHRNDTIVTLCGGGLDSAYLLAQLAKLDTRVFALSVDLGDDFDIGRFSRIADRFDVRITRLDCRHEFVEEFVQPAILAGGRYLGQHPVSASLSRPLIARVGVEFARSVGARCLLHTANQSQNSLRRLNGAISDLGFEGHFGSPYELDALSRDFKRVELQETFGVGGFADRFLSTDTNLWCREFESGTLDDPEEFEVDRHVYQWSIATDAPSRVISLGFERGRLVAVDGQPVTNAVESISNLNTSVGQYGIGRFCSLEHLESGEKVLEVREAPAAALVLEGFAQLASATVEVDTLRWMRSAGEALIVEAVEGRWFRGLRQALQSFLEVSARAVSGEVRFTLRTGGFDLEGFKAVSPLYIRDREQWEYRKAAAARSVAAVPGDGLPRADSEIRLDGEKGLHVREYLPHDASAQRSSPRDRGTERAEASISTTPRLID